MIMIVGEGRREGRKEGRKEREDRNADAKIVSKDGWMVDGCLYEALYNTVRGRSSMNNGRGEGVVCCRTRS